MTAHSGEEGCPRSRWPWSAALLLLAMIGVVFLSSLPKRTGRSSDTFDEAMRELSAMVGECSTLLRQGFPPPASIEELIRGSPRLSEMIGWDCLDPWGKPYRIVVLPSGQPEIASDGPDRIMGSRDDLSYLVP